MADPNYRQIGNPSVIANRQKYMVPIPPGGTLSDYVPFYFTPWSVMLYNIVTGYGGVEKVPKADLVILTSSLQTLAQRGITYVCTDRHALLRTAYWFSDLGELDRIDWNLLNRRDFRHDPEDPGKFERYQAEALVYRQLPVDALSGIACYDEKSRGCIETMAAEAGVNVTVRVRQDWYLG